MNKKDKGISGIFTFSNFLRGLFVSVLGAISMVFAFIPVAVIVYIISAITQTAFPITLANNSMLFYGIATLVNFAIFGYFVRKFNKTIMGL